jgi:hypothetical protein
MRRFSILVVQPDDYVNYAPFLGVAKSIYFALRRLGYDVRLPATNSCAMRPT